MADLDDIATLDQLAKKMGSKKKALDLLRRLDVPVWQGVFSQRLLLARLEHRPGGGDAVDAAVAALARYDLVVVRTVRGHPTLLTLAARGEPIRIGQLEYREGEKSPFAPLVVRPGERYEAVLYVAKTRTINATAAFGVSGLGPEEGPPLFVFYLASEDRLWVVLRRELREFYRIVVVENGRQPWFTRTPRLGSLRVALPRAKGDLDADLRVLKGSTIP